MSSNEASSGVTYTEVSNEFKELSDAPPSLDYVLGPKEPEQSPPLLDYIPGPEYPKYLAPSDYELPEDPKDKSKDGPTDYPADGGNDDEDDDDEEEEEEHLAPADSTVVASPPAYHTTARMSIRSQETMPFPSEAEIPSPPLPVSSPPTASPTYTIPLGYKAAEIRLRAASPLPLPPLPPPPSLLLPLFDHREEIPEADLPPRKRLCLIAPTPRLEEGAPTTLEGVNARVTELAETHKRDTQDLYAHLEDARDSRAHLSERDDILLKDRNATVHYELQAYRAHTQIHDLRISSQETSTSTLIDQILSLQTQLIAALGRIDTLKAREPAHADNPEDADSSSIAVIYGMDVLCHVNLTGNIFSYDLMKMAPRRGTRTRTKTRTTPALATTNPAPATTNLAPATATTPMTDAAIRALIAQGVTDALAEQSIQRNTTPNDDGSQGSGSGIVRPVRPTREYTYNDFLKCQPLNFNGTEGVVGLTQWFKRMETLFYINNCVVKNQVKFTTCTLHSVALTWWKSHVNTVGHNAAYDMPCKTLMKMMTTNYTQRFQELALLCGRMFPEVSNEAIEMANDLMDQKLRTLVERRSENKRKQDENFRNNHNQQQANKSQNTGRAYTVGWSPGNANVGNNQNQRATRANQKGNSCYECGAQGHFKRECPKLKNKNHGNQGGNGNAPTKVYREQIAGDKPSTKNVVTGTFLLNNRHAAILFHTSADRSFVSTAFSSQIDITPTTLDHYYDIELADGKIIRINTIIRGCALNLLNHPFNIDLMPVELGSFDVIIGMDWLAK
ncbi:reverse transcriptase domain-containing protein [Tanacetum coccineum]|uniref:Reverse transcriptase domain-containing protein n=1 Tax=Tanacetum coccineum TaxID=301880 RepID=A0ABQ5CB58_9ASTR